MKIEMMQSVVEEFIQHLKNTELPIVLYGAGSGGVSSYHYLVAQGVNTIEYFSDDRHEVLHEVEGIPVKSIEWIDEYIQKYYVVVTCRDVVKVKREIEQKQLKGVVDIFFTNVTATSDVFDYKSCRWDMYYDYLMENKSEYEEVYTHLADEQSKKAYKNIIEYRMHEDNFRLIESQSKDCHYFEKGIISLSDDESFMDIGAYKGDTLELFLKQVNGKYNKIICVEPDKQNYDDLSKYISENKLSNVTTYNKGIWSEEGRLLFYASGSEGSALMFENKAYGKGDENYIEVTSVDTIAKEGVTFIKMDVEGAELACLEGAVETIKKYKPTLAIAGYHKKEDMVKLPLFIKQIDANYEIFFRHYRADPCDTLFYAVYKK